MMDLTSKNAHRKSKTWLSPEGGSFDDFLALVEKPSSISDWPNAAEVSSKVPLYDGNMVREVAGNGDQQLELMAEWTTVFESGPGIIVIKKAIADERVIDGATAVFDKIIEEQRKVGGGGGDHFAKPGANDRIWNAAQKHCLADPENFVEYFGNGFLDLVSRAWLGDGYQVTAQVNRVNPGGAAQVAHRDYHLGFMSAEKAAQYPSHVHRLSPALTLQGGIAHCDMPLESGPTTYLPFSQLMHEGYVAFGRKAFQDYYAEHHIQLPLEKGDAVFFNPAVMHAAGDNKSKDIFRLVNLLQVSSAFGRAIESVDRTAMSRAAYSALLSAQQTGMPSHDLNTAISCISEGYPFPTNLDLDLPVGGLAPKSQADLLRDAIENGDDAATFFAAMDALTERRTA